MLWYECFLSATAGYTGSAAKPWYYWKSECEIWYFTPRLHLSKTGFGREKQIGIKRWLEYCSSAGALSKESPNNAENKAFWPSQKVTLHLFYTERKPLPIICKKAKQGVYQIYVAEFLQHITEGFIWWKIKKHSNAKWTISRWMVVGSFLIYNWLAWRKME